MSICAGIGGLDLGVRLACPQAVARLYIENEITAAKVLVSRIKDGCLDDAPIWSDVKTFKGKEWRGHIDMVIAGYPCTPFSCAGKQRGAEDPRHLWPHVARIIREVEPEGVFLENVANHLRIGFEQVRAELRAMGYRVKAGLFTAAEVGAPHLRKRLFALAYRDGAGFKARDQFAGPERAARRQPRSNGAELADGSQRRSGIVRQPSGSDGLADGRGEDVENATSRAVLDVRGERNDVIGARAKERPRHVGDPGRTQLENTARLERDGSQRQDGGRRRGVRQAGHELADPGDGFVSLARRGSEGRTGTGPAGAEVAHPGLGIEARRRGLTGKREGRRSLGEPAGSGGSLADAEQPRRNGSARQGLRANGPSPQASRSGSENGSVADASRTRLQKREDRSGYRGDAFGDAALERTGSLFPPGPDDLDAWRELLGRDASLEPAFRGDAAGLSKELDGSSRVDRLRSLGNSVLPACAALAFLALAAEFSESDEPHSVAASA